MIQSFPLDWTEAQALLRKAKRWAIVVHEKPDGDALGSGAALTSWGRRLGKSVCWGGADPFPAIYDFLHEKASYRRFSNALELFQPNTLIVCLDTSNQARSLAGMKERPREVPLLVIDHHRDNERYGDVNIVCPEASSTAELLWDLALKSDWEIDRDEALSLYTALTTDSGRFSFSSTTPYTHRMAAALLERGVEPQAANQIIYNNRSLAAFNLWGRTCARAVPLAGGQALLSWVEQLDFNETGAASEETEGLVNELMAVKNVSFAVLLTEERDLAHVHVSLRSSGGVAAGDLAARWGGGGHRQAAGCRLETSLKEAIAAVSREIEALHG